MSIPRLALGILFIAAAVTAAILLNLVLLGAAAQNDSIGNLSSRANLPHAPSWTVRPRPAREHERGRADD